MTTTPDPAIVLPEFASVPADLTTQTPVEVDTLLLPIWSEMGRLEGIYFGAHLDSIDAKADLANYADEAWLAKRGYADDYHRTYQLPDMIERAEAKLAEALATKAAVKAVWPALLDAERPYSNEFENRGGWYRYYLVMNTNGHVHRETNCSTCFPTTRYGWLVNLSGCNEETMVDEYGETACTVCFPDAPSLAGWAASIARKEAEKAATQCPEIWPLPSGAESYRYSRYGTCKCGAVGIALSSNGKLLKHQTPEQAAAEAARKATFGHPDGKKVKDCTGKRAQKTPKGAFNSLCEGLRVQARIAAGTASRWYFDDFKPREVERLAEALALYNGITVEAQIALAHAKNADDESKEEARRLADLTKRLGRIDAESLPRN